MITRLEIDGFKSFYNFSIDLKPFQVVIGPNGVGKSNLFDAIRLLSDMVRYDRISQAFIENRGEVWELFSQGPDGHPVQRMTFAAEMLIAKSVTDASLGVSADVSSNRLRYELQIEQQTVNGLEQLRVTHESLAAITRDDDHWVKTNIRHKFRSHWIQRGRQAPYISTEDQKIAKHQDRRSGRKQETPIEQIERTILSTVDTTDYPTAYAARQEMLNWRFLQFSPEGLRTASSIYDNGEQLLPDGSNLAAVLFRMKNEDPAFLTDVSRDMVNAVKGVKRVHVENLKARNELLVTVAMRDGQTFSSRVVSDGTLRLLALVTLKHDPNYKGVLTFEEPENGVAPQATERALNVLHALATDLSTESQQAPSQVIINTHSPYLLTHIEPEKFLFTYMVGKTQRQTRMIEMEVTEQRLLEFPNSQELIYTIDQLSEFMRADPFSETWKRLDKMRQRVIQ